MRRQIVLALVIKARPCHHLLARSFEFFNGTGCLAQRNQTPTLKVVELQKHFVDVLVFGCQLKRHDNIAQSDCFGGIALKLANELVFQAAW